MFKVTVLLAIVAIVYGAPTTNEAPTSNQAPIPAQPHPVAALSEIKNPSEPLKPSNKPGVAATIKAINGEEDPKNEKEELEGAEFGWGLPKWGWGYPSYETYYEPTYYYSSYPSYPSYRVYKYWW